MVTTIKDRLRDDEWHEMSLYEQDDRRAMAATVIERLERENAQLKAVLKEASDAIGAPDGFLIARIFTMKADLAKARSKALEEAAKTAEEQDCDQQEYRCMALERAAETIRALKEKP